MLDTNSRKNVLLLAALAGAASALSRAMERSLGDELGWPAVLPFSLVTGALVGVAGLYIAGLLISWTGRWIGGKASPVEVRTAMAWACVPMVAVLALWVPKLAIFGQELFTAQAPTLETSVSLSLSLIGFLMLDAVLGIWSLVILLMGLGQVHGFSAWKALGNLLLAALVMVAPLIAVVALATFGI